VFGALQPSDGRWQLVFTRSLPHPPERVWRALTEPEHLAAWFPTAIEGERSARAALRFVFRHDEGPTLDGEMLVYDRLSVLEFRWGDERLRFELHAEGDGCRLRFVNTFDELGKAARDAAGWHACLDLLGHDLDGTTAPFTSRQRWDEVHDRYVADFGPQAATIGPPATG
jgi:uncharacterized protein YndB with AHSA1/START domain